MRTYRIGKLVKETGVTQDTLKFYEKQGILTSDKKDSGYRYYSVPECGTVMQIRYLRQLGFTVKEVSDMMKNASSGDIVNMVEQKIQDTDKSIHKLNRTKEALKSYQKQCCAIYSKPNQWLIEDCPDYYFLKHTTAVNFLEGKNISNYIKNWTNELIDINMSLYIPFQNIHSENEDECFWGFSVAEGSGQMNSRNEIIKKIHLGKCLIYIYSQKSEEFSSPKILEAPLKLVADLGYSVAGDALCHFISQTTEETNGEKKQLDNFIIMIPIC